MASKVVALVGLDDKIRHLLQKMNLTLEYASPGGVIQDYSL